jgi:hypothetical protein
MKKALLILVACSSIQVAQAQFFGGYADGVTAVPTGNNAFGTFNRLVYDDFTFDLAGDIITFGMIGMNNTGSPGGMYYEIRSGVSVGNGGTLLFSGITGNGIFLPLPVDGSVGTPPMGASGQYVRFIAGTGIPIHLDPGTYWIGLAPVEGFGSLDVTSTQGLGAVGHPINNGNAFYFETGNPAANFSSLGANDFGLEVNTAQNTNVIPEPGTWTLLMLGAAGLFYSRRVSK